MLCIFALPRSRTAWLAEWLTHDGHRCQHEPLARCRTLDDLPKVLDGASFTDTGAMLHHEAIRAMFPDATFIVIERPLEHVYQSLAKLGPYVDLAYAEAALKTVPGQRFRFDLLSDPRVLREIWALASDRPFDELHARRLIARNVQRNDVVPINFSLYSETKVDHISHLSAKGKMIVAGSMKAIYLPQFKQMFDGAMQQSNGDMAQVCAQLVLQLIHKGLENVGDVSPDELYGDRGVDDAIMDVLFEWLKKNGYEVSQDIYNEALNMTESAAAEHDAQQMGGQQQDQGQPPPQGAPPDFGNTGLAGG